MSERKLKNLKFFFVGVIFLPFLSVVGLAAPVASAASAGTCLITSIQGAAVNPPNVVSCDTIFQNGTDAAGSTYDSSKCYTVYEHDGSDYIEQAVSCADSRFNGGACPTGYTGSPPNCKAPQAASGGKVCGSGSDAINVSIDLGCRGKGNPILDLLFAVVRFLSAGVGLVLVGSMVYAGIQYTGSRGDPGATAQAVNRIRANVFALLLFIFAYAILNYLIPGQLLK